MRVAIITQIFVVNLPQIPAQTLARHAGPGGRASRGSFTTGSRNDYTDMGGDFRAAVFDESFVVPDVDRESLALDGGVGDLIGALSAQHGDRLVVLVQSPGAFVAPWRDSVAGILAMFLGGQETGAAWASILFGDRSPAGRLPLMLPATEDGPRCERAHRH
ncbi:unnamed protein product [Prorocentrum cordatum]|uniref:beta-glucosidase n=1 Tax=Prorocentrum cordatum TaxID=2364126 RepID=A0ABN9R0N7_9DINO|nr:unnamed protein product [Polarella glacialis]